MLPPDIKPVPIAKCSVFPNARGLERGEKFADRFCYPGPAWHARRRARVASVGRVFHLLYVLNLFVTSEKLCNHESSLAPSPNQLGLKKITHRYESLLVRDGEMHATS